MSISKPRGAIVYSGPSRIDGAPIVAIVTFETSNAKTGDMAQLWIVRRDMTPIQASKTGADRSVCGSCPLMGKADGEHATGRACYVNLGQGPRAVHDGFLRGLYPVATDAILREGIAGRGIRLGAYGDPVAVPLKNLRRVLKFATGHTGYTHQWRMPLARGYEGIVMASVENESGAANALGAGWRYFRVRRDSDPIGRGEIVCPASDEGGKRRDCNACRACDGRTRDGQASVVIIGHGGIAVASNLRKTLATFANNN